jgi:K+-transporting ATPase A subunit
MANYDARRGDVGGVRSGLFGMLHFAIVAVFVAGLMIGRSPEFIGKKIVANEVKMTMIALLCVPLTTLGAGRRALGDGQRAALLRS